LGSVIDYLSTQMGFFLVILLPVLLFTVYQIYKLIAVILYNQKVDVINAAETASDEMKEAIIAEYLAKQKKEEVATEDKED
jgi:signal peptidase